MGHPLHNAPALTFVEVQAEVKQAEARRRVIDWVTIAVALAILLWIGAVTLAFFAGYIGNWTAGLLNIIPIYCCQIVAHEAAHGNIIRSARHGRWFNGILGHIFAAFLFWDFQTFRHLHMVHHRETNHPHRDVDRLPGGTGIFARLVRALFFFGHALAVAVRLTLLDERAPRNRWSIIASWALFYGTAAVICLLEPVQALSLWILPAVAATAALTMAHWSLHTEEADTDCPFRITRVLSAKGVPGRFLSYAYLFQNNHLVHHLFPYVPFHRMAAISDKLGFVYRRKRVDIVGLDFSFRRDDIAHNRKFEAAD